MVFRSIHPEQLEMFQRAFMTFTPWFTLFFLLYFSSSITATQVSAGYYHTIALSSDGSIFSWGYNQYGQLGDGTNITRLSPVSVNMSGVEWKEHHTSFCWRILCCSTSPTSHTNLHINVDVWKQFVIVASGHFSHLSIKFYY